MIARFRQGNQSLRDGADTCTGYQTIFATLQLRESELELSRGGVRGAGVEKTGALAAQILQSLIECFKLELNRLVNGRYNRSVIRWHHNFRRMINACGLFHPPSVA